MSDGKNGFSDFTEFDFKPIGMAIKKARESQGITREQLSEKIDYAPRHIQAKAGSLRPHKEWSCLSLHLP